mgnify:CR=1 FL=1
MPCAVNVIFSPTFVVLSLTVALTVSLSALPLPIVTLRTLLLVTLPSASLTST